MNARRTSPLGCRSASVRRESSPGFSKRGVSLTEFVIIAPVVALLWLVTLEVNEKIEARHASIMGARNIAEGIPVAAGKEALSAGENLSIADDAGLGTRVRTRVVSQDANVGFLQSNVADAKLKDNLALNLQGHRLDFRIRTRDRTRGVWKDERENLVSRPAFITSAAYATASGAQGRVATVATSLLDAFKGERPIFIDDTDTTLEAQLETSVPLGAGLWENAVGRLLDMTTRVPGQREPGKEHKYWLTSIALTESEAGYRPWDVKQGSLVGLGLGVSVADVRHWGEGGGPERSRATTVKEAFTKNCQYIAAADDNCALTGNPYSSSVHAVAVVMGAIKTIANIFSGGSVGALNRAAKEGIGHLQGELMETLAVELESQVRARVQDKVDALRARFVTRAAEQGERTLGRLGKEVLGNTSFDEAIGEGLMR